MFEKHFHMLRCLMFFFFWSHFLKCDSYKQCVAVFCLRFITGDFVFNPFLLIAIIECFTCCFHIVLHFLFLPHFLPPSHHCSSSFFFFFPFVCLLLCGQFFYCCYVCFPSNYFHVLHCFTFY